MRANVILRKIDQKADFWAIFGHFWPILTINEDKTQKNPLKGEKCSKNVSVTFLGLGKLSGGVKTRFYTFFRRFS